MKILLGRVISPESFFPEGVFQELAVFLPGAAADDGGIDESNQQSEAGERKTGHPEEDEADCSQPTLEYGLSGNHELTLAGIMDRCQTPMAGL